MERVTKSMVYLSFRPYKVSSILPAEIGSKAEVGSSKRMILGLVKKIELENRSEEIALLYALAFVVLLISILNYILLSFSSW